MTNRTIGTTSVDAKLVYEHIKKLNPGDTVTYLQLSQIAGRNITKHRHILETARRMALREDGIVFDCISKVGIKRLSDSEIVAVETVRPLKRIRSAIRNGAKRINCAKNITNDERVKANATLSLFGTLHEFSKPSAVEKVSREGGGVLVPVGRVLEMFG